MEAAGQLENAANRAAARTAQERRVQGAVVRELEAAARDVCGSDAHEPASTWLRSMSVSWPMSASARASGWTS